MSILVWFRFLLSFITDLKPNNLLKASLYLQKCWHVSCIVKKRWKDCKSPFNKRIVARRFCIKELNRITTLRPNRSFPKKNDGNNNCAWKTENRRDSLEENGGLDVDQKNQQQAIKRDRHVQIPKCLAECFGDFKPFQFD